MIIAEEIDGIINSNVINTLGDSKNCDNASGSIESFNTESQTVLNGKGWDGVRAKLDEFNVALKKSKSVGNNLLNTVNDIVNEYKKFFGDGDDESLNVAYIPDIENSIIAARRGIVELQGQLNSTVLKVVIIDGKETYVNVPLSEGDPGRYNAIKALIANCEEQIVNFEIRLAKLRELKAFIEKAKVKLTTAMQDMNEYQQMVDSIVVSTAL